MKCYVSLDEIGYNATEKDLHDFVAFANKWMQARGHDIEVEAGTPAQVEYNYTYELSDEDKELCEEAWTAWLDSLSEGGDDDSEI